MFIMTPFFLQATNLVSSTNSAGDYLPIAIQLLFAGAFVFLVLGVTHLLGPKRNTEEKLQNFESGIESVGNARQPMAIKYFLVAILFVLFDVEVIFFYPYAVNFRELGWGGFEAVLMFVGFFLAGFICTTIPPILVWAIGHHLMKINPAVLMGGVAGARSHSGPAREAAKEIGSSVPWIGFPVGYAVSGVLLTVFGYLAMVMSR